MPETSESNVTTRVFPYWRHLARPVAIIVIGVCIFYVETACELVPSIWRVEEHRLLHWQI
ncbi:hypothetical protein ACO0K0_06465 [Undibacterium sp. SXout11W]|uniref:hypothetical protein n=1 Tax=Undibacterium sp. SXout11W TaxID=3413050 RepID=UPI003BF3A846